MAGPITKDTSSLALGLAQCRILASAANIGSLGPVASASDSIGALTKSQFTAENEVWRHMSGFPQIEDHNITLSKKAMIEAEAEELSPYNLALALGEDPVSYTDVHSGQISLGALNDLPHLRSEMHYSFPDTDYTLDIVFPRAQITGTASLDFQALENVKNPITIEAKRADSEVTGGHAAWDSAPLGMVHFFDAS